MMNRPHTGWIASHARYPRHATVSLARVTLCAVCVATMAVHASAATYYVRTTGSDLNLGIVHGKRSVAQ